MTEDLVRLRLAIQTGLLTNVPASVRLISVDLVGNQIYLVAIFDREPTDDERGMLLGAGLEAADDFSRNINVNLKCASDGRPMTALMADYGRSSSGYIVYARHEGDFG